MFEGERGGEQSSISDTLKEWNEIVFPAIDHGARKIIVLVAPRKHYSNGSSRV